MNTTTVIWLVAAVALFAFLWWKGHIKRFAAYCGETKDELMKCAWPTWAELKGSTVVVFVSIAILGLFTFVADQILFKLFINM